jgi:hypothetical protein
MAGNNPFSSKKKSNNNCIFDSMKFVLEVKESKAETLMALLNDLPYVKTKPLTPYKAKVLEDVKEAVDELNAVLSGKIQARNADDLMNEL